MLVGEAIGQTLASSDPMWLGPEAGRRIWGRSAGEEHHHPDVRIQHLTSDIRHPASVANRPG